MDYRKSYFSKTEYNYRLGVFSENLREISELRETYGDMFGVNEFADMTKEEKEKMFGLKPQGHDGASDRDDKVKSKPYPRRKRELPDTRDWTNEAQWPVKNQGSCGSCWTFSAIGSITGNCGIHRNKWYDLAEQDLVDCARKEVGYFECSGCGGGWMSWGIQYVIDKEGAVLTNNYPYKATDGSCLNKPKTDRFCAPKDIVNLPPGSYEDLVQALDDGPVAVGVNASPWHSYQPSGDESVLPAASCPSQMSGINHGVVAVGWGTDVKSGKDYWLLKNSWGPRWGLSGYIKIERSKDGNNDKNACGILQLNSVPVFTSFN